jgi:hypothetical protein
VVGHLCLKRNETMTTNKEKPAAGGTERALEDKSVSTATVGEETGPRKPNIEAALAYIGMIVDSRLDAQGDGGVTLVAYERNKAGKPRQRYVEPDDLGCEDIKDELRGWLLACDADKYNLYWQANHAVPAKNGVKAAKADIDRVDWVHVDIDVPAFLGEGPTPADHHARHMATIRDMVLSREFLKGAGFPGDEVADIEAPAPGSLLPPSRFKTKQTDNVLPSLVVCTGNGYQALWRLSYPIHAWDRNTDVQITATIEKCERVNKAVAKAFSLDGVKGDSCHNVDRVLRLPGSVNYPSDQKVREKGSDARGVLVTLEYDEINRQFGLGTFPSALDDSFSLGGDSAQGEGTTERAPRAAKADIDEGTMSAAMAKLKRRRAKGFACAVESEDYPGFPDSFMEKYPGFERLAERIITGTNEIDPPASFGDRSATMYGVCLDLLRMDKDFPPKYIQGFILNPEFAISAHVRDPGKWKAYGSKEKCARKHVSNAMYDVEEETLRAAEAEAELAARAADGTAGPDEEWLCGAAPSPETGETVLAQGVQRASALPRSATQPFKTAKKKIGNAERDVIIQNSFNYALAVLKLGVRMSYDLFSRRELVSGLDGYGPEMDDAAFSKLSISVEMTFGLKPKDNDFRKVLNVMATTNSFHPVRDYLDGLKWDGEARIDTWLIDHAGTEDTVLNRAQSRLWLMAAVARIRTPGAKFDQMPILEGEQGIRKTTLVKALVPNEDWFTDTLRLGMDSKVTMEQTGGVWIAEIGELSGMSRKEVGNIKTQLSRTAERARGAFQRYVADARRQFVMIGTTNDEKYLYDDTGGRRFWPMKAYRADVEAVAAVRDQLWAEASERLAQGETLLLDPELYAAAAVQQEERRVADAFEGILRDHFSKTTFTDEGGVEDQIGVTTELNGKIVTANLYRLLGYATDAQVKRDEQRRIASAMKLLGFKQGQYRFEGERMHGYCRGGGVDIFTLKHDEYGRPIGVRVTEKGEPVRAPSAPPSTGHVKLDTPTENDLAARNMAAWEKTQQGKAWMNGRDDGDEIPF